MHLVVSGTKHGRPDVAYWLRRWMRHYGAPEVLIVGCARGVDRQARAWASRHGVRVDLHVADWSRGKRAGPERNARMVHSAPVGSWLLAFPDVDSRGTPDAVRRGHKAGLRVLVCPHAWPQRSSLRGALRGPCQAYIARFAASHASLTPMARSFA